MSWHFFTTSEKQNIVKSIEAQNYSASLCLLCRDHNIEIKQLIRWKQAFQDNPCPSRCSTAKSFHPGWRSTIQHLEQDILSWFEERSLASLSTSISMLVVHLCQKDNGFWRKTKSAQTHAVHPILPSNNIVYCQITHKSQSPPQETITAASEFICSVAESTQQDYIINMGEPNYPQKYIHVELTNHAPNNALRSHIFFTIS